ncbi:hypothetical protein HCUR_00214 [Holospora curviuscula]|uniref:Uncharacterized protein n=1 Tax=Holospora curviuscula TaxID=1082868 RepID=A0A2S5RE53_9PROT|nr:hypothetical protein HCUR_00214 [Holospora curviuscula]
MESSIIHDNTRVFWDIDEEHFLYSTHQYLYSTRKQSIPKVEPIKVPIAFVLSICSIFCTQNSGLRNTAFLLNNTREFLTYHGQVHVHQLCCLIHHAFGTIQIFFLDPLLDDLRFFL